MTFCETCGSFIEDFQDCCEHCGRVFGKSCEPDQGQMLWLFPIMSWADHPRYSAVNGRRLKDADLAFCLSSVVPGLGQAYDERRTRGAFVFGTFIMLLVLTALTFLSGLEMATDLGVLLIIVTITFWVVQLIDAVRMTADANGKISGLPELR